MSKKWGAVLTTLPAGFGNLFFAHEGSLDLSNNQLSHLPPEFGNINVELWGYIKINLSNNQLTNIPSEIENIVSQGFLFTLVLSNNQLTELPQEIGNVNFTEGGHLDLSNNKLSKLPASVGNLSLRWLSLNSNQLVSIPPEITNLTNLWKSDFGYNKLNPVNSSVTEFLDQNDPDWAETQTIPPSDLQVSKISEDSIGLSWSPIPYKEDGGYYLISFADQSGGPYTVHGTTSDKTVSSYLINGVSPSDTYYLVVQTFIPAHEGQQNNLLSQYSKEVIGFTRLFGDVLPTHWAHDFIEAIYNAGLTSGCSADPRMYCPGDTVSRAQIAVFLENGIHYPNWYSPPDVEPSFGDTAGHWAEDWIEALYSDGITAGCSADPLLYCPDSGTTRAQMAVFLLKSKHGSNYTPPDVEPTFNDTTGHWAEDWIEQLYSEGITAGCGSGSYCPESPVTRAQMAVFLTRTFNLPMP